MTVKGSDGDSTSTYDMRFSFEKMNITAEKLPAVLLATEADERGLRENSACSASQDFQGADQKCVVRKSG